MSAPEEPDNLMFPRSLLDSIKTMTPDQEKLVRLGVCPECVPPEGRRQKLTLVHDGEVLRLQQWPRVDVDGRGRGTLSYRKRREDAQRTRAAIDSNGRPDRGDAGR